MVLAIVCEENKMGTHVVCIDRLEKVDMKSIHSQGKVLGTLVTVGGAMIMTMVRGATIALPWSKHDPFVAKADSAATDQPQDSVKGALMIAAACLFWACFVILQVRKKLVTNKINNHS